MNNEFPKTVSLPSGKTASITRKGKVRDLVFAARIVGKSEADNQFALSVAAMAPTIELDGKPVLYEDLLEIEMDDLNALAEAAGVKQDKPAAA